MICLWDLDNTLIGSSNDSFLVIHPGIRKIFTYCCEHYPTYIVTSCPRELALSILRGFGIEASSFSGLVGFEDATEMKPRLEPYLMALKDREPQEGLLVFGDKETDFRNLPLLERPLMKIGVAVYKERNLQGMDAILREENLEEFFEFLLSLDFLDFSKSGIKKIIKFENKV